MDITKEVNPHFEDFLFDWNQKFQFLMGGYGSSKSYHVALKIILKLLSEKRKALVIREVYDTHKDSTFSLFTEIIEDLGLLDDSGRKKIAKGKVRPKESPYELKFSSGSRIIFKGMDKPAQLKSINNVSLIWLEECSEVKYEGFKELIGRLRHPTLKLHMILSTNPIGEENWTYMHFFKDEKNERIVLDDNELYEKGTVVFGDTYYHHSTADDNLFLPESYIEQLDELKEYDPDLHRVARLGRKEEIASQSLIDNLRNQVAIMSDWAKNMKTLAAKGVDDGLIAELQTMGPKALAETKALISMSDVQLNEFQGL